ncbi:tRNA guanosine(15) transglycosylase TgtA [Candidatus Bathyarchaeota archaeon ex4484_205]|nr:MAG: tRNA guanosine(15) transglycosylase TgtA [Candidatus Bathyarchaeota archaeon ex4484_205]RLG69323.1 MAG: tRNA guanosine(15) transglycosylase TgtA [archaeon]
MRDGRVEFEIVRKDILARIGKLKVKGKTIETPTLLPVINPWKMTIKPKELWRNGFKALITNAYLLWKRDREDVLRNGIHSYLNFPGMIVTDSGAYQILKYGSIEITQDEILNFQIGIGADIGVILDIPTRGESREEAEKSIEETIVRAREAQRIIQDTDMGWIGPIQGGGYIDLLEKAATEMEKMSFDIYAVGSPTIILERYDYPTLVDMILSVKRVVKPSHPLHLFGAGHPAMLGLAVALGCDLFDSAAYALFAYDNRYLTENGTLRLEEIEEFPCVCPICRTYKPKEVLKMEKSDRERLIALHNLFKTQEELRRVKESIRRRRLWEYLEVRTTSHPSLRDAFKRMVKYNDFIEQEAPQWSEKGIFILSDISSYRPEVVGFRKKLERYRKRRRRRCTLVIGEINEEIKIRHYKEKVDLYVFKPPYGAVPSTLLEAYPMGKTEITTSLPTHTIIESLKEAIDFLKEKYNEVRILVENEEIKTLLKEIQIKTRTILEEMK